MSPYITLYNKLLLWIEDLLNVKAKTCGIKIQESFLLLCRRQFLKQDPNSTDQKGGRVINLAILKFRNKNKKL